MIFLTPKQNRQRNAVVVVLDFAILKDAFKGFVDGEELKTLWRGILHDYIQKITCLNEHATCFWTIEQSHKFTDEEKEFFGRMLSNWEQIDLASHENAFSLARKLKEGRNFKQATFVSTLVPSISPVVFIDAQEWLWEVEFLLGPDTNNGLYMLALRLSEVEELDSMRWQDNRLFMRIIEAARSHGKLAQPVFFWKQLRTLGDLEHYYQYFAAISGISTKYNGFDGFHTWEAINKITDGKGLSNCEKFLKAQMSEIEDQKKQLEQQMNLEN